MGQNSLIKGPSIKTSYLPIDTGSYFSKGRVKLETHFFITIMIKKLLFYFFCFRLNIVDQDRSSISPPCGVGMSIGLGTISLLACFPEFYEHTIFFTKIYIFTFLRGSI